MRYLLIFLFLFTASASSLFAQEEDYSIGRGQAGIDFMLTFPQGEFKETSDKIAYGLALEGAFVLPQFPVAVGLTGTVATYGSRTFKVPFSGTVQLVNVDLTTSNNVATGHLFLRLQPQDGVFRPYFEGLLGFNVFWTESTVKDERYEDKDIAGSTNLSDVAFSYGGGGGLQFRVYEGATDTPGQGIALFIDAKVRYLYGGRAKYFDEESITFDANGAPVLLESNALESHTDMLQAMIGVSVRF
ncbi:MAG: hypothetical protein IH600_14710 [Bacteroidetes bacterium]|nr:hypothetical protein [Bacteroidota bacterium]